jgi:hypothetical protein
VEGSHWFLVGIACVLVDSRSTLAFWCMRPGSACWNTSVVMPQAHVADASLQLRIGVWRPMLGAGVRCLSCQHQHLGERPVRARHMEALQTLLGCKHANRLRDAQSLEEAASAGSGALRRRPKRE